jgi:hypothetical protein
VNAIDVLEEAVNLLRGASLDTALTYLIGAAPLTLAFLFFLADMSRSAYASDHLPWASLALALLYVWKISWQAMFMAKLYRQVSPSESRRNHPFQAVVMQATFQPIGLILPLPFPWVAAFFRNIALYAGLGRPDAFAAARQQSVYATRQNWAVLSIVSLGSLLLFANILMTIFLLPQLGRSLLGIEGDLARLGFGIANLTTLGVAAALTWLAVDPLLDAAYVLRCFYGESRVTGADLRAALKKMVLLLVMITAVHAQPVDQQKLDQAIDQVVHQREFTWRSPRREGAGPEGKWVGWYRSTVKMLRELRDLVWKLIQDWLRPDEQTSTAGKDTAVSRKTIFALITFIACLIAAGVVVFFLRRTRRAVVTAKAIVAAAPPVNLADESLTADRLPESEWLALADQWMEKGDFRMALKAMYLAALNYLSARDLVSVRRWKSGLDYRRELARRARSKPEVAPLFDHGVATFEQGWYGRHEVDRAMAESLATDFSRMRSFAK